MHTPRTAARLVVAATCCTVRRFAHLFWGAEGVWSAGSCSTLKPCKAAHREAQLAHPTLVLLKVLRMHVTYRGLPVSDHRCCSILLLLRLGPVCCCPPAQCISQQRRQLVCCHTSSGCDPGHLRRAQQAWLGLTSLVWCWVWWLIMYNFNCLEVQDRRTRAGSYSPHAGQLRSAPGTQKLVQRHSTPAGVIQTC